MSRHSQRSKTLQDLEAALSELADRLTALEARVEDRSPASEIDRLNLAFDLIADRAPASEIDRLNQVFELLNDKAPASETDRLNQVFELLNDKAPASEITRLDELYELLANFRPSERVVEVPWVIGKYGGERRVLEVGYAYGEEHYLRSLQDLSIPFLVGLDAAVSKRPADWLEGMTLVQGDVLKSCFREGSFELILCVSTIEHIGRDNTVYGHAIGRDVSRPDIVAMTNMSTWLAPGGRLLLTVPYGVYEDRGWLINYDAEHLRQLIDTSELEPLEERYFGWAPGGWREMAADELSDRGYQSMGASHASAVALVELGREVA